MTIAYDTASAPDLFDAPLQDDGSFGAVLAGSLAGMTVSLAFFNVLLDAGSVATLLATLALA